METPGDAPKSFRPQIITHSLPLLIHGWCFLGWIPVQVLLPSTSGHCAMFNAFGSRWTLRFLPQFCLILHYWPFSVPFSETLNTFFLSVFNCVLLFFLNYGLFSLLPLQIPQYGAKIINVIELRPSMIISTDWLFFSYIWPAVRFR